MNTMTKNLHRAFLIALPLLAALPGNVQGAVGRTQGSFDVSPTGAATYQIPLWMSPGAGGMQPSLTLSYDSQRGTGIVGPGWALTGLSAITRCNRSIAQDSLPAAVDFTGWDKYCLDGKRLRGVSGTYGWANSTYETEIADFSLVHLPQVNGTDPVYFTARTKSGLTYEYGNTSDSRITVGTTPTAYMWLVNKVTDRAGNSYKVTYGPGAAGTSGTAVPLSIEYSPSTSGGTSYINTITFVYDAKEAKYPSTTDKGTRSYVAGNAVVNTNLLLEVKLSSGSSLVRRYVLGYEQAPVSLRPRLERVTECASADMSDCLAPTTIGYQNGSNGVTTTAITVASGSVGGTPLDMDGDGRGDVLYTEGTTLKVARGTPSGGFLPPVTVGPAQNGIAGVGDLTTKGFDDIIVRSGTTWTRYTWNGSSFTSTPTNITLPTNLNKSGLTDVNGDGRLDAIAVVKSYNSSTRVYTNTVHTWLNWSPNKDTLTFAAPVTHQRSLSCGPSIATSPCDADMLIGSGSVTLDFNGDGMSDIMYRTLTPDVQAEISRGNLRFLSFNETGTGFTDIGGFNTVFEASELYQVVGFAHLNDDACTDVLIGAPVAGVSTSRCTGSSGVGGLSAMPRRTIDWNSDGRSDVLVQNGSNLGVAISTASGFQPVVDTGIAATNAFVIDFDGDGLQDLGTSNSSGTVVYRHASPSKPPDLVTSITDGYGVNVSPVYGSILNGNYTKGTAAVYPERDLDTALYVVTEVTSTSGASDGSAAAYTQTYEYFEGRENLTGRGLEGFKRIRITDQRNTPAGNRLVRDIYRHTDFPLTGLVHQEDLSLSSGTPISKTLTHYDVTPRIPQVNNKSFFPYMDWTTTETFEVNPGGGSFRLTKVDPTAYDSYGNATTIETTVTDTLQGSLTYGANWTSTITHTIAPNTNEWCLNVPTQTIVRNTAPGVDPIERKTTYVPDYPKCRIASETIEPDIPELRVVTGFQYDGFGNVNLVTVTPDGQAARTTQIDWGPTGRYTEKITNALSQDTVITWNHAIGARTKVKDPNLLETSYGLDSFGRMTSETRPDQTTTDFALSACASSNNYCGIPGARSKVAVTLRNGSNEVRTDTQYFDLFDRPRHSTQELLGNNLSQVTRKYDVFGRLTKESIPHDPAGTPHEVSYEYDLVGRTTLVRRPESAEFPAVDNETSFSYAGPTTTTTDALNHATSLRRNPVGKVVAATDAAGKTTTYTYDAFGNLHKVKDSTNNSQNNETILTYNRRGMKTRSQDPDMGDWSYEYYPLGELKKQTDARGKVVELQYDALSRMTKRKEEEGDTNWIWGADDSLHNIGRLERVEQRPTPTTVAYYEEYTYDAKARLYQRELRDMQSPNAYTYQYEYDALTGQLGKLTYPAVPGYQLVLDYVYENALLREVKDSTTTYWRANAINPLGQVTQELLGNNVSTRRTIDLVTGLASKVESGIGSATNLQNEAYLYDKVGNVTQRQKYNLAGGNLSETFHYDALNRLEDAIVTAPTTSSVTVNYDELGNITSRTDVANGATWTYHEVKKHAVIRAGSDDLTYTYDANGNAITRNGYAIDWTTYNYPSVIRGRNKEMTFSYGPDRQRYRQVYRNGDLFETTEYIGGALEKVNLNGVDDWRHYISANGGPVAIVSRKAGVTTTRYLLRDHLGSIATIVDSSGAAILSESFEAFGGRREGEDWNADCNCSTLSQIASITRHGFTGHEMIGGHSMGLVHMNGRVMDSVTGRFLSADPFVQFPFDSQSFNRYSYVRNNPLSTTDPSGFQEYDGDVREPPDWEPSPCWMLGGCWWSPPTFPRPNYIPRPKPQIPVSRATPQAMPGPAVLPNVEEAENSLKDWVVSGIDVVTDFVPGVSTVKGIYEAYKVFSDPNSTTLDKVIATAGILPGGKGAKYGSKIVKAIDSAGDTGKAAAQRTKRVAPNPDAKGPHTTWKTDENGNITRHETWDPNARNPTGWDSRQSTDVQGGAHRNSKTGEPVPTPHTQGKDIDGGVRPAHPDEIPQGRYPW
jgi:RHS repeat-associated protein